MKKKKGKRNKMANDLTQIKKLRQLSGAGIMDCREALEKSKGDFDKAKKYLLEKGAKLAEKKADRETKSGLVEAYVHTNGQVAGMVKLVCETDFVARNKDFKKLAFELAMQVAAMNPKDVKELMEQEYIRDSKQTVEDLLKETIGKIKENIKIEDFKRLEI
jgi:elongation factor Ts